MIVLRTKGLAQVHETYTSTKAQKRSLYSFREKSVFVEDEIVVGDSFAYCLIYIPGVSNCFVFKSRLQEYAQKVGLSTPVYETSKEGPSHEPTFKSTVMVNNVRYDSLSGFYNRKAAEQSAAEVALMELAKSGELKESISQPVQETGLCKNLLQEYAQKMNFAIPTYDCQRDETPGRMPLFSCTVEIGGIRYIGAAARTKKEAEIKAARTALLAIKSSSSELDGKPMGNSKLTVIPCKKKGTESAVTPEQTAKALKPKKSRFKKKPRKKLLENKVGHTLVENMGTLEVNMDGQAGSELDQTKLSVVHVVDPGQMAMAATGNFPDGRPNFKQNGVEISVVEGALVPHLNNNFQNGQQPVSNFNQINRGIPDSSVSPMFNVGDLAALVNEANKLSGVGQVASMVNNSTMGPREASSIMAGVNQTGDGSYIASNQG
ncbi:hypothetical protein L1049_025950 [Liquidambar formosana]|uniref:DRBM domain-containing protein n=1 Tax=Liquidambar formosana TaxID=63359 RepID=A0AAP0NDS5_LIQFO